MQTATATANMEQSRFLEAPLLREAEGELKNVWIIYPQVGFKVKLGQTCLLFIFCLQKGIFFLSLGINLQRGNALIIRTGNNSSPPKAWRNLQFRNNSNTRRVVYDLPSYRLSYQFIIFWAIVINQRKWIIYWIFSYACNFFHPMQKRQNIMKKVTKSGFLKTFRPIWIFYSKKVPRISWLSFWPKNYKMQGLAVFWIMSKLNP